jgi:hypothetical protein
MVRLVDEGGSVGEHFLNIYGSFTNGVLNRLIPGRYRLASDRLNG